MLDTILNLQTDKKKELIRKLLLSDFWKFVKYMDVKKDGKEIIYDIDLYHRFCNKLQNITKNTMILLPRRFAKTLIAELFIVWYIINYPNKSIALFGDTLRKSKKILKAVHSFLRSPKITSIFGNILADNGNNQEQLTLTIRDTTAKESNVEVYGIDIPIQSIRADLVIYEDIIGMDFIKSRAIRETTFDNFFAIRPTLESNSKQIYIGTRYAYDDLPAFIKRQNEITNEWEIIEESVYDDYGNVQYPEIISEKELNIIKESMPTSFFASQYLNKPIASENAVFLPNTYKTFSNIIGITFPYIFFGVDLAVMKDRKQGDLSSIVVCGKDGKGTLYLLDASHTREGIEDLYTKIKTLFKKWSPKRIYIEAIGAFDFIYNEIKKLSQQDSIYLPVYKLMTQSTNKEIRIETTLEPLLRSEYLLIPDKSYIGNNQSLNRLINEEMVYFDRNKDTNNDDLLDAFEIAIRFLKTSSSMTQIQNF